MVLRARRATGLSEYGRSLAIFAWALSFELAAVLSGSGTSLFLPFLWPKFILDEMLSLSVMGYHGPIEIASCPLDGGMPTS